MLGRWFGSARQSSRAITDALYGEIVAAARQPLFYSHWNVPDTPIGRFEMLSLHMFLFLHRLRGETGAAHEAAQELTDSFFRDVDHSLRELGVSDQGVPRRMKKLARMFYGRAMAYGTALDQRDQAALGEALARNVLPDRRPEPAPEQGKDEGTAALAAYVFDAWDNLVEQPVAALLSGRLHFPDPKEARTP
ncbi:MAG: ubiquinol-cytochrome C chaperone [Rhizobiaceae bacterium]|nr:MAG: ubiquinol-cytochrome C chaperone [Rhizobiaceae bacterium]